MRLASLLVLGVVACGGDRDAPTASRDMPVPSIAATPIAPDDVVVATVDGRPVYGSCVVAQAAHGKLTRDQALAECIDFELAAGAAAARSLGADPEVREATRAAMVNRLVEREVEARLDEPDTVRPLLEAQLDRIAPQMDQPEFRESVFIRVEVPAKSPETTWDQAKVIADKMYAELDGQTGLFEVTLKEVAERARKAAALKIIVAPYQASPIAALVPAYGRPLFAIPEVGRVAPPARTKWGYDIILMSGLTPAKKYTRDEVAVQIQPEVRRLYFKRWLDQVVRHYGTVEIDEQQLAALEGL